MKRIELYELGDWTTEETIEEQEHQKERVEDEVESFLRQINGIGIEYDTITNEGTRLVINVYDDNVEDELEHIASEFEEIGLSIEEYEN